MRISFGRKIFVHACDMPRGSPKKKQKKTTDITYKAIVSSQTSENQNISYKLQKSCYIYPKAKLFKSLWGRKMSPTREASGTSIWGSHKDDSSTKKVSWNVIGARDAKRFVMGGGNHSNGVENMCAGFAAKRKGLLHEEITSKEILLCGRRA